MSELLQSRRMNRGQGGFTLIELLVVIAILAVLAGVAVFAVNGLTDDAETNACKVERETMMTANQASLAAEDPEVADHLDDGNITVTAGQVEGKYWEMSNTPADPNPPVAIGTLPAGCP